MSRPKDCDECLTLKYKHRICELLPDFKLSCPCKVCLVKCVCTDICEPFILNFKKESHIPNE